MNSGTGYHPLLVCAQITIDLEAQHIGLLLRVRDKCCGRVVDKFGLRTWS